jgi:hypothetical protein
MLALRNRRARSTTAARAEPGRSATGSHEEGLAGPDGADAGQVGLVEQGGADGGVGSGEVRDRPLGVEAGVEQVGAEMADQGVLVGGADEVEHAEIDADGGVVRPGQNRPDEAAAHGFGTASRHPLADPDDPRRRPPRRVSGGKGWSLDG